MKSLLGIPAPQFVAGVDLPEQARRGRRRLYPVSAAYLGVSGALLGAGLAEERAATLAWAGAGLAAWTLAEYLVHRHVLHRAFPDSAGPFRHFLHRRFDDLHWRHHLQPWNGAHINGTLRDTGLFVALFLALVLLAPMPTAPAFLAGFLVGYVGEEWVHHSVHFYRFRFRYFRPIQRHHLSHHSPRGRDLAFGLSSYLWDALLHTQAPARGHGRLSRAGPSPSPPSGSLTGSRIAHSRARLPGSDSR